MITYEWQREGGSDKVEHLHLVRFEISEHSQDVLPVYPTWKSWKSVAGNGGGWLHVNASIIGNVDVERGTKCWTILFGLKVAWSFLCTMALKGIPIWFLREKMNEVEEVPPFRSIRSEGPWRKYKQECT